MYIHINPIINLEALVGDIILCGIEPCVVFVNDVHMAAHRYRVWIFKCDKFQNDLYFSKQSAYIMMTVKVFTLLVVLAIDYDLVR